MIDQTIDRLSLYGRKHIFKERLQKGYTEFCFGQGVWENETVILWAFFHPEGKVCTFEFHKTQAQGGVLHQTPFGEVYTLDAFRYYIGQKHIRLSQKKNLAEFFNRWHSDDVPEPDMA